MTDTDFSNAVHLQALLGFVDDHFEVFQSHEQIENTYILKSLVERISPERMKPLDNDIHSDHTLTKLRTLIGELKLRLVADESEIVECGNTLKTAVQQFAVDFFPHMEEEESVRCSLGCSYSMSAAVCPHEYLTDFLSGCRFTPAVSKDVFSKIGLE